MKQVGKGTISYFLMQLIVVTFLTFIPLQLSLKKQGPHFLTPLSSFFYFSIASASYSKPIHHAWQLQSRDWMEKKYRKT